MDQSMIDQLAAIGVEAKSAVARFGNNEAMFLKYLRRFPTDQTFHTLEEAVAGGNRDVIRTTAHTLKGVCGNLGLTPAYEASIQLMNTLRASDTADFTADYQRVAEECKKAAEAIARLG